MVDIVIVNWNSGDFLKKCLHTVFTAKNERIISRVFIIDNNSADTSLEQIEPNNKTVLIRNAENLGFSKACNQGFRLCTAPYVLLLNPDAQLLDETLSSCFAFMNDNNKADILGCKLLDDIGNISKSCARFPTAIRMCFEATGLSKIAPGIFTPASLMTDWDHTESRFVDQVMGAFIFMRISVFEKAGYFDERFFVYYEELDFSERLSKMGGRSYFNASISAIHSGGGTTRAVKGYRLFLNLRSRLQYAKKHFKYPSYLMVKFCTMIIEPFSRTFFLLITGKFREIKDVIKGYKLLVTQPAGSLKKD